MSFGVVVIIAGACGGGSTAEPAAGPNAAALPQRLPVVSSGKVPDGPLSTPSSTPALPETQPAAATPAAPAATASPGPGPTPASPLTDGPARQAILTVIFRGDEFDPKRIEIEVGQAVRFVNESNDNLWPASNIHPTHEIYPEFDAGAPVLPGGAWELAFEKAGVWRYHNHLDPSQSGLVVVTGDGARLLRCPLVLSSDVPSFEPLGAVSPGDAIDLFRDDALLDRYLQEYGPAVVIGLLSEYESQIRTDCHQRARETGRMAYDLFGAFAFSLAGHECHAGA